MSSKHTPGPWLIEAGVCHCGDVATVYSTSEGWVAIWAPRWMDTGMDEAEQSANARLIAAAPDLLEALQFMIKAINYSWPHSDDHMLDAEWKAKKAIDKATGEKHE